MLLVLYPPYILSSGARAAPVWNSSSQEFVGQCFFSIMILIMVLLLVGMLTISDFVNILIFHYKSPIVSL